METNRLNQFCVIYETSNLREASEIIGMTHGALSKSLKLLERELSVKLFLPEGRGITPTKEAELLYPKAKKIILDIENLTNKKQVTNNTIIKMASFEVFTTYFMSNLKLDLSDFDLELHELVQGEIEEAVRTEKVDFGVTTEPIPTQGVEFLAIKKISSSPYVVKGSFKNSSIIDIPFAAPLRPIAGAPSGVKGLDGWPEHKFPRKIRFKVDMLQSAIELCRQGLCAILIPDFLANLHNQNVLSKYLLEKKKYPEKMKKIERTIYLVKKKNREENPIMKKVARFLRSL